MSEITEGMRLTNDEVINLIDVSKEHTYSDKVGHTFTTTVNVYPLLDAQLTKVADRIRGMENPHEEKWKHAYGEEMSRERDLMDGWDEAIATILKELKGRNND